MSKRFLNALLVCALPACAADTLELEPGRVPPADNFGPSTPRTATALGVNVDDAVNPDRRPDSPDPVWRTPDPDAIVRLGLGRRHTCAVAKRGTLHCWGAGDRGQIGHGNRDTIGDDEIPQNIATVDLGAHEAIDVVAGDHHTCVLTREGDVLCFGVGGFGQLGSGNVDDIGDDEVPGDVAIVELGAKAIAITAGEMHTCALLEGGGVVCFGAGNNGRLGYASTDSIGDDEVPMHNGRIELGMPAVEIAAGGAHTCARADDGRVRCWGKNEGRLGYGFTEDVGDDEHPADVGDVDLGGAAIAIDAGTSHTCALLEGGAVTCFGLDPYGELGLGLRETIGDDETPAAHRVDLGAPAKQISTGNFRTCARFEDGTVRCFGYPYDGGLGAASTSFVTTPRDAHPVGLGVPARLIRSGADHSCAIVEGGKVRCWGSGADGRLGYGTTDSVGDDEMPSVVGDVPL